jgi:hypothetical protein
MSDKDTSAVERANAMVAALQEQYPELVAQDLENLIACWVLIQAEFAAPPHRGEDAQALPANCDRLYRMSHDFKGHAGSYGYPVASVIADSICQLLKSGAVKTAAGRAALGSRVKALEVVIKGKISGDTSERGRKVLAELSR